LALDTRLVELLGALKTTVRTGWMLKGVPPAMGESVAEHSFESAVLTLIIALEARKAGLNVSVYRSAAIALVHDLAEELTGDIPRGLHNYVKSKERVELKLAKDYLGSSDLLSLLEEYYEGRSLESKLARMGDLLSTYIHAKRLEERGFARVRAIRRAVREEITRYSREEVPELQSYLEELMRRLDGESVSTRV